MANGRPMRHSHLVPIMWNDRDPLARFPRSKPYNGDAGGTSRPNLDSYRRRTRATPICAEH